MPVGGEARARGGRPQPHRSHPGLPHLRLLPPPGEVGPWSPDFHPTEYAAQRGDTLHLGSASIEVMAGGRHWVAPNLVLHYVSEHGYLPPAEVVAALGEPGRRP